MPAGPDRYNGRERAALRRAEAIAWDCGSADDDLWAELHTYFSEPELVELGYFTGLTMGQQRFLKTLQIKHGDLGTASLAGLAPKSPVSFPGPESFRCASDRCEQAVEVLATRSARGQMSRDARVALRRRGVSGCQFGVHVQQFHRLSASHIARVGPQEAVESCPAVHECPEV